MPVAVRLVEVLAIIALVASMAVGAGIVIIMEKSLSVIVLITDPLVNIVSFLLGGLKYAFLQIMYKLTSMAADLVNSVYESMTTTTTTAGKCAS